MKIKVAILGYGNLGMAIEQEIIKQKDIELVAIFTRRNNIVSKYNTPTYLPSDTSKFVNKIDLLILCSGSMSDSFADAKYYCKFFNIINTFDTHSVIPKMYQMLNRLAKKHKHLAIISTGWDPGLFSYTKATFSTILQNQCSSFWGKGTSLGHSQAVKQIAGVEDAISFTIPNKKVQKLAIKSLSCKQPKHFRKVFIVSKNKKLNSNIKKEVLNMPHYFKGQKVSVKFVNQQHLNKIKSFSHKGEVICSDQSTSMHLKVNMQSNPQFTAQIVLAYARAFRTIKKKYNYGALTPLHFSPLDLSTKNTLNTIKQYC